MVEWRPRLRLRLLLRERRGFRVMLAIDVPDTWYLPVMYLRRRSRVCVARQGCCMLMQHGPGKKCWEVHGWRGRFSSISACGFMDCTLEHACFGMTCYGTRYYLYVVLVDQRLARKSGYLSKDRIELDEGSSAMASHHVVIVQ